MAAAGKKVGDVRTDTNVLVVGAKGCGKTTLIMRFLNPERSDSHRETMGLDYVFARRSKGPSEGHRRPRPHDAAAAAPVAQRPPQPSSRPPGFCRDRHGEAGGAHLGTR